MENKKIIRRLRVVNVIEEARLGGPQIRITEVAKHLKGTRYDSTVILPSINNEDFQKRLELYDIDYIPLPIHRLSRNKIDLLKYAISFPYEVWGLYRVFRKYKFNIVHISGGSWQYKGVIAGNLAGCKIIWHLNDTRVPEFMKCFFKFVANKYTHGFIVAGERVKKYYLDELKMNKGKPIFEIQAPVDCSFYNPDNITPDPKMSSYKGINIVSVGNVNPFKGFEYYIHMAKELNKDYSTLNFWIVGAHFNSQKRYFKKLQNLIKQFKLNNCYFYGASEDIRRVLKSADIYVCASIAEASPLSVWEAMSMEKPIVATDVGDISRFIQNGENGYIVPAGDSYELSRRVKELLENKEKCKKFGAAARKTVVEKLDIQHCVERHKRAYKGIIDI